MSQETKERENNTQLSQLAIDEIRLRYQEEADRRTAIESKIGTVLTVDAIIISAISVFSDLNIVHFIAMSVALLSVLNGILSLRSRDYHRPGLEIENYLKYIYEKEQKSSQSEIVKSYITAIIGNEEATNPDKFFEGNKTKNDQKVKAFERSLLITFISITIFIINPLLIKLLDIIVLAINKSLSFYARIWTELLIGVT